MRWIVVWNSNPKRKDRMLRGELTNAGPYIDLRWQDWKKRWALYNGQRESDIYFRTLKEAQDYAVAKVIEVSLGR